MASTQISSNAAAPSSIASFLSKPFNPQGSALQWFAFIGLLLVCLWLWHAIARDLALVERD